MTAREMMKVGPMVWATCTVWVASVGVAGGDSSFAAVTAVDKGILDCMDLMIGRYGWCEPVMITHSQVTVIGSTVLYITVLARTCPQPLPPELEHPA